MVSPGADPSLVGAPSGESGRRSLIAHDKLKTETNTSAVNMNLLDCMAVPPRGEVSGSHDLTIDCMSLASGSF
jgi:hypothetical protein